MHEDIPNEDRLYYRVHQTYLLMGELKPGVFREIGDGMSTDWAKYSTPLESRNRAKKPEKNGIVSFIVGGLRNLNLTVVHAPSKENRAHTNVKGVNGLLLVSGVPGLIIPVSIIVIQIKINLGLLADIFF